MIHFILIISALAPMYKPLMLVCGFHEFVEVPEEKELSMELTMENSGDSEKTSNSLNKNGSDVNEEESDKEKISEAELKKLKEKGWGDLVERLKEVEELKGKATNKFENIIKDGSTADKYIYRERNYEDIMVKDVFPTLETIDKPFSELVKLAPTELEKFLERNEIIQKYRKNLFEAEEPLKTEIVKNLDEKKSKKILNIKKEDREKYFDKSLTFKKEEQLSDFIEKFLGFDPDKGDLPMMFRDLYYKNLQRLAYNFSADSTYFTIDYFQENLNKEDYLKNSMKMLSDLKGTKTASEILFSLENIYEIQSNAIQQYFSNQNLFEDKSKEKELRKETIKQVLKRYKPLLKEKNLNTYEDVWTIYSKKKEEIIDYLIKTTPENYRISDAYFEKGRILWDRGIRKSDPKNLDEAIKTWNKISSTTNTGDFLNEKTFKQIEIELKKNPNGLEKITEMQISQILNMRLFDTLNEKKIREDKILWKKVK